jgi:hypothetical protein
VYLRNRQRKSGRLRYALPIIWNKDRLPSPDSEDYKPRKEAALAETAALVVLRY